MSGYEFGFVPLDMDVSASVNSVFGRTGAVAASVGDYNASQVTNAANLAAVGTQTFAGPIQATSASVSGVVSAATQITAPPASASVAVTLGTPVQNTLGYDAMLVVFVKVTAATTASILAGVSSAATPPVNPYVSSDSLTGVTAIPLYVPNSYYALVGTQGTITESATGMWCPV